MKTDGTFYKIKENFCLKTSIYQKVKNQVTDWNKLSASQIKIIGLVLLNQQCIMRIQDTSKSILF